MEAFSLIKAITFAVLLAAGLTGCASITETGYDPEQQAAMILLVDNVAEAKTLASAPGYAVPVPGRKPRVVIMGPDDVQEGVKPAALAPATVRLGTT